jgi:Ni/Fe-hydrogenase 1 B-type cytochrome subunit
MANPRIRTYAWEFPIRLVHWINFLCIVAFIATGLYIGNPYSHANDPATYLMGYMRYVHFVAGYAFLCTFIIRLYWSVMGNRYASWRVFFPFLSADRMKDFGDGLKFYTFVHKKPPYAVGHTATAGLAYLFVFLLFAFQIVSGFALMSLGDPTSAIKGLIGGWLHGAMDIQNIRLWHHMNTYAIIAFFMGHIYVAWWMDSAEKNGLMGSIFSGYKFVTGKEWE